VNKIVELATAARTMADINVLESALQALGFTRERMLGDIEANYSSLANPADPRVLVPERLTNSQDGIFEYLIAANGVDTAPLRSPQDAAHALLGVPVAGVRELTDAERAKLGAMIELSLMDSDDSKAKPTLWARDYGSGPGRSEVPLTLLSLHGSNKLRKPWLHGVYGQGGSLTLAHCDAAVYITRKQPSLLSPGEKDVVTVAVVREVDRPDSRLPYYRYLVEDSPDNPLGLPFACPADQCDFKPGVLVIHINYDMRRMGESTWNQEASIYAYLETLLYRPAMPYTIRDARSSRFNQRPPGRERSVIAGLGARLDNAREKKDSAITGKGPATLNLPGIGPVAVTWYLFADQNHRRSYAAKDYTAIFTHWGQVHHSWNKTRFTDKVKHRRVAERIFVEIDTSGIPAKLCSRIFSSFRDQLRSVPEASILEDAVAKWLSNDTDLVEVEAILTREALKSVGQQVTQNFLDKLNRAIEAKIPGSVLLSGVGPVNGPKPPKPKRQDELGEVPTYLEMAASISILPGQTVTVHLGTNAVDGFIPDKAVPELSPAPADVALSYGYLSAGRLQMSIAAGPTALLMEHKCNVRLSFLAKAGGMKTLEHPLTIRVVAAMPGAIPAGPKPPPSAAPQPGVGKMPYAFLWSKTSEESDWNDETAGELRDVAGTVLAETNPDAYSAYKDVSAQIPTVCLNESYLPWLAYQKTISASDATIGLRKSNYAISLGVTIAELYVREKKLEDAYAAWEKAGKPGDEPSRAMTEQQRRRAVSMAARGIVTMLPNFDIVAAAVGVGAVA
jgi:hypothetical protein